MANNPPHAVQNSAAMANRPPSAKKNPPQWRIDHQALFKIPLATHQKPTTPFDNTAVIRILMNRCSYVLMFIERDLLREEELWHAHNQRKLPSLKAHKLQRKLPSLKAHKLHRKLPSLKSSAQRLMRPRPYQTHRSHQPHRSHQAHKLYHPHSTRRAAPTADHPLPCLTKCLTKNYFST